ncbi:MAG: tRNA-dihydrouridine synthase family protein [Acidobacteriota bacterium]
MTHPRPIPPALLQPIRIGPVAVLPPTALAPMADLTDVCLRSLIKEQRTARGETALGLVVTEFLSARSLVKGEARVRTLLSFEDGERPVSVQIYGADPAQMGDAARIAADAGADLLDINMGCPVSKITGHGSGAALLKDPPRARAMVEAVRRAVALPVTVKMRAGWCAATADPVEFARGLEGAGAAMIAVHPRTREDGYRNSPRGEVIRAIKDAVSVPVLGNGDVLTAEDGHRMLRDTGCDGLMVGRGALKDPHIFCELMGDAPSSGSRFLRRLSFALAYLERLAVAFGPRMALHRGRKLLGLVFKGEGGGDGARVLRSLGTFADVGAMMDMLRAEIERGARVVDEALSEVLA